MPTTNSYELGSFVDTGEHPEDRAAYTAALAQAVAARAASLGGEVVSLFDAATRKNQASTNRPVTSQANVANVIVMRSVEPSWEGA
jgi:hypothetical protein